MNGGIALLTVADWEFSISSVRSALRIKANAAGASSDLNTVKKFVSIVGYETIRSEAELPSDCSKFLHIKYMPLEC